MKQSQPANMRNVIAACAAITAFGFAFGMTYPLLSLILESRGIPSDLIGINSAMMPIGILLFSMVIPALAQKYGAKPVAIIAGIMTSLTILAFKQFDSFSAWLVIRLVEGMAASTLFVLSEAWIVGSAGERHRGKIIAIYACVLSASFGAGPLLISFIGIEGWLAFIIGASVVSIGIIPFFFIQDDSDSDPEETQASGIFNFVAKAPMLLAAVAVFAIFDAASLALFPVYGQQNGLNLTTSANLLTALILGNTVLQFLIGWLSDRFSHRWVLVGCALVAMVCCLLFPLVINNFFKWPILIIMGAASYGIYTVSLAALGNRFSATELVNGSASFAIVWGLGALLGTISGGWAMFILNTHGLPIGLAIVFLILAIGLTRKQLLTKTD